MRYTKMSEWLSRMKKDERSGRDSRNPYGSRGGYVRSNRRDRNYDMAMDYGYDRREYDRRYDYRGDRASDFARNRRGYKYDREYGMDRDYADYDMRDRDYDYDYDYDYARGDRRDYRDYRGRYDRGNALSEEELMAWSKELMKELEEKDKLLFTKENIEKKAKEMGIKFDEYTFPEFYTTVLMLYSDFNKTLGKANFDTYICLAKDWLADEDAEMQYGEKLAAYYDSIVEGE